MKTKSFVVLALIAAPFLSGEVLGFFDQKFTALNFDKGKWARTDQERCRTYTALENGATVRVLRFGTSNLVPFKAAKDLKVLVCGSSAAFDEGFEAEIPLPESETPRKR